MRGRDARAFWLFVGPFLIGLAIFAYLPIGWSAYLSFFDARNTVSPTTFVGLDNYIAMLGNEAFLASLGTFSVFAVLIVPVTFVLSLALALAVNRLKFARAFFRSVFFLPFACSYVVASLVWKTSLFSGVRYGLVNTVLGLFGVDPVAWTGTVSPPLYWVVLVTARLWLQLGFYMILFIAALLLNLINAYQAFDEFYNIMGDSRGYPPFARPPLVYLYYTSLGSGGQDLGRGSAGAVILALLIALVTLLQGKVFRFTRVGS
jgi:multiple sugar transport system permease protein